MVKRKTYCAGLALCALLSLLSGCGESGEQQMTPPADTTIAEPSADTSASELVLVDGGTSAYTLYRPELADSAVIEAAVGFRSAFERAFGAAPVISDDWVRGVDKGEVIDAAPDACQILVGETNRAETAAVRAGMNFVSGYRVAVVGRSLVFLGTNDSMTVKAVEDFTAQYLRPGERLALPADFTMTYDFALDSTAGSSIIGKFRVACDRHAADRVVDAAARLCSRLGYTMTKQPEVEPAIVVGAVEDYPNSVKLAETLDYLDYTISLGEKEILIVGGSPLATQRALERFLALFEADALGKPADGFTESFDFSEVRADSLLYHLDEFVPVWTDRFTPPDWMHDFAEKSYAILAGSGRFVSDAHRGDHQNYPENSLEGIYSAVLLGADCIEIDIRLTADYVPVLMHDATLKRTTDWEDKHGKDGLPSSADVADWTYAELLALNLMHRGAVTEYKIPTAYEAVAVCAGRCFIHWDGKVELDVNEDIYALADELGAKESFYYYYSPDVMWQWAAKDKEDAAFGDYYQKMGKYLTLPGHAKAKRDINMVKLYGDNPEGWERSVAEKRRMVFTNKIEDLCRYIAEHQQPQRTP